ncbi:MAG: hypothetical protein K2P78_03820, partial [Gemmataceae bacterium]|nr:hypothetical protein [Gemmataceae bacterium]
MASSWLRRFLAARPRSSVPVRQSLHCLQLEDRVVPYSLGARWLSTAANLGPLTQGDATVITWGFVRDGLTIPGNPETGEPGSASTLVTALDAAFGGGAGGLNYANRPWFHLFQEVYDR